MLRMCMNQGYLSNFIDASMSQCDVAKRRSPDATTVGEGAGRRVCETIAPLPLKGWAIRPICSGPRGLKLAALCFVSLILSAPALAEPSGSATQWIAKGAEAYEAGDYAAAVEAYTQAGELLPDQPEIMYNLAAAHYKQGDYDRARELFTESLRTKNQQLEEKAKFNLGNVAYAQALEKLAASEQAADLLKQARRHYRDALEVDPEDEDARANIELAQQLLQQLLQRQQQQQQNKSGQNDKKDQPQQEGKPDQPSPPQPQSQPSSQPSSEQQDSQQQKKGGGEPDQKPGPNPEKSDPQKAQQQKSEDKGSQDQAAPSSDQLSREEAERLLQSVRDRERQRREELARRRQANRPKVKRDW